MKKLLVIFLLLGANASYAHEADHGDSSPTAPITEAVQTGQGKLKYTTVPGWGKIPGSDYIGSTHGGIVVDKQGLVYVSTNGKKTLCVFKADGTFVKSFGPSFNGIHGMNINTIDGQEYIFAAAMGKVMKIALDGSVVMTISGKEKGWKRATAVAVAADGKVFIADGYGSSKVYVYSQQGEFIKEFGGKGNADNLFSTSHGLGIDTRGERPVLLVCDRENRCLKAVDLETLETKILTRDLRRPCALSLWGDYTAIAELEGRVVILDKNYKVVSKIGDNPDRSQWAKNPVKPEAWQAGIFTAPHGVSFDEKGNLYVMDWNRWGRVTKLTLDK